MTNHTNPAERGALRAILRQLSPERAAQLDPDPEAQIAWADMVMDCSPQDIGDPLEEAIYAWYFLNEPNS